MSIQTFGEILKAARRRRGLSLAELAKRTHVDASFLSRLESGKVTELTVTRAVAICNQLGIPLDALTGEKSRSKKSPRAELRRIRALLDEALDRLAKLESET
jgi:transcriptional regulator with XRE-family HTH domain